MPIPVFSVLPRLRSMGLRNLVPAMSAVTLLAGCALLQPPAASPPTPSAPPPAAVPAGPPPRTAVPVPRSKPLPPGLASPGLVTDGAGRPLVVGLNRQALIRQFGTPRAEREAPPARVMEFGHEDCRLAAYLYFDTARSDFYALQYEVNDSVERSAQADRCLARIARNAPRP